MGATSQGQITFRGIRERNLNDQMEALGAGYNSVAEYAIDELARRLIALEQRMEKIENRLPYKEFSPPDPED